MTIIQQLPEICLLNVLVFCMELIKITPANVKQAICTAIGTLEQGGIVAYPTETYYGLGVRFDREDTLEKLYIIKQRPKLKAIPLIIGDRKLLSLLTTDISEKALFLMDRFWPGPLTFLLPAQKKLSECITSGTRKVAVRIPGESFALRLAQSADFPITSTSANPSGLSPAQDAGTVVRYFQDKIDLVIDGDRSPGRDPSTLIEVIGDKVIILREGAIKKDLLLFPRN
jgi:L-threonylcarbamoyladenylate synthase